MTDRTRDPDVRASMKIDFGLIEKANKEAKAAGLPKHEMITFSFLLPYSSDKRLMKPKSIRKGHVDKTGV